MSGLSSYNYLRLSVTDQCDFNCFYCQPSGRRDFLSPDDLLTRQEIQRLVGVFVGFGVEHVRLTGGEPLVRPDFLSILEDVVGAQGVRRVSMTTNGHRLFEHSRALEGRLDAINVSLDTLKRERFAKLTGRDVLAQVKAGIASVARAQGARLKLNVLLIRGFNDDEILDFIAFAEGHGVDVRFIEYFATSSRSAIFSNHVVASSAVRAAIEARYGALDFLGRDAMAGPAQYYRLPGASFKIGFISSVTEFFCGSCNRLRLTADGRLYPCLHAASCVDLKEPLRRGDDEELKKRLATVIATKKDFNKANCSRAFEMSAIGG